MPQGYSNPCEVPTGNYSEPTNQYKAKLSTKFGQNKVIFILAMPGNFYTLKNPFWKTYQKMYCQQKKSRIQEKKTWILGNTGINQGTQ